jgi:hypothetical protein
LEWANSWTLNLSQNIAYSSVELWSHPNILDLYIYPNSSDCVWWLLYVCVIEQLEPLYSSPCSVPISGVWLLVSVCF